MIRIIAFLLIIIVSVFSCSNSSKEQSFLYATINWHAKKHKKDIHLYGSGGSVPDKINYFTFYYEAEQLVTKNEARRIIVELVEDIINKVNGDPSNAVYLNDFPITCKNVDLGISFVTSNFDEPSPPYISLVFVSRDDIIYEMWDKQTRRFINKEREKYEDALNIIQQERGFL